MGLDISLLETFTLVADLRSFSDAARRLGLTQPAVSFQVKALEKELGADLIDRSRGRVRLTPAGRTAYDHARKILADREEMIADIPRTTGEVAGQLRIGASTIPGELLLPPVLAEFKDDYPEVTVTLDITDSADVARMVAEERVELGFMGMRPDTPLKAKKFAEDRLVVIVPPRHPLYRRKKIELADLASEHWVVRSESSGTRDKSEKALKKAGIPPAELDIVARMGSNQAVLSAVAAGMGIAIVSDLSASEPAKWGMFSAVNVAGDELVREFYAVHAVDRPLSKAAEEFLKTTCGAF